jgi:hypothetical protein
MRDLLAIAIGVLAGGILLVLSFQLVGEMTVDRSQWLSGGGLLIDVLRQLAGGFIAGAIAGRRGFVLGAAVGLVLVPLELAGVQWFWGPAPWCMLAAALPFSLLANVLSHSVGGAAGQLLRMRRAPSNNSFKPNPHQGGA